MSKLDFLEVQRALHPIQVSFKNSAPDKRPFSEITPDLKDVPLQSVIEYVSDHSEIMTKLSDIKNDLENLVLQAAEKNDVGFVRTVIDCGMDISKIKDEHDYNILHTSVASGGIAIIDYLANEQKSLFDLFDDKISDDGTPLQIACYHKDRSMVECLIDAGSEINRDMPKNPLPYCLYNTSFDECKEKFELLLARGADVGRIGGYGGVFETLEVWKHPRMFIYILQNKITNTNEFRGYIAKLSENGPYSIYLDCVIKLLELGINLLNLEKSGELNLGKSGGRLRFKTIKDVAEYFSFEEYTKRNQNSSLDDAVFINIVEEMETMVRYHPLKMIDSEAISF